MDHHAPHYERQPFHHSQTSMGGAGHWLKTAGILAPLVIGEFVKDADKRSWQTIQKVYSPSSGKTIATRQQPGTSQDNQLTRFSPRKWCLPWEW
jgi:hypothetical protein